jgi:hypothetical protein
MLKPNPVIVDGNLQLNSLSSAILGTMEPKDIIYGSKNTNVMYRGRGIIIKSFINILFKTVRDLSKKGYDPTHLAVVWDKKFKGKYSKTLILDALNDGSTYKSDRTFVTREDLKDESLSKEERLKLESKIIISEEFLEARKFLQTKLNEYGIVSYSLAGWEADDIDYIWGLETNKLGGNHIHCSGDSDWKFHLTGNDILWQTVRGKLYIRTKETVRENNKIPDNLGLMEWKSISTSALGSHNNLLRTVDPSIKRFTKKYKDLLFSGDTSMIGKGPLMDRYQAQLKTFNIEEFEGVDTVRSMYKDMLNVAPNSDEAEFLKLLLEIGVSGRDQQNMRSSYSALKSTLLDSKFKQLL